MKPLTSNVEKTVLQIILDSKLLMADLEDIISYVNRLNLSYTVQDVQKAISNLLKYEILWEPAFECYSLTEESSETCYRPF